MKIAVVGSGIAGLTAAWLLRRRHDITVYEADDHIGGHTHTVPITRDGRTWAVDTGFIVFNRRTYPTFCAILERLGVPCRPSTMSFSVQHERDGVEWNGSSLATVFAQRRRLGDAAQWRMLIDILRFAAPAERLARARDEAELPLAAFLERLGMSAAFRERYLWPMTSAIWSMPPRALGGFPARFLCRFLDNHGMLRIGGRPQWLTVVGGSWRYVAAMTEGWRERIRLATPVYRVQRRRDGVEIEARDGSALYDQVVLACHADQALRLLADPTPAEREILSALPYTDPIDAVLHTDTRVLPRHRACWGAWNAVVRADRPDERPALTYDMNILQGLSAPCEFLVSLGLDERLDPAQVLKRVPYQHPAYRLDSPAAQRRWAEISGVDRIHYCGAYWGWGFHEDGCVSGLRVARALGEDL
ncbi:MAG: FAD-dependent oxidoreductase [Planctomycetota bacterium]|nr:FAD-dependent oxidoreductase [Planctomycetota bacterium]MCX8040652.1 FAD-dependent oxidoreductase [Planctomycetota bacterium]MDW8372795.1 FAD-dependent oxidoreductase [Planctomycetota bacterium]